ncbi:aminoglycoside phosphotransferase family protein [Streptomyces sp. NPDC051940]|uniref:aminoglycoside phosphotransferase family protein n=1 Tax=Streptomyces sp. NPDC051940 TaxID=3155675 RepID=UPI0034406756
MTDADLVRRLVAGQFPQWAGLPLREAPDAGSDHVIFRLGDDMAVRLPRDWAAHQAAKDERWLPLLAPRLPLPVPVPLAVGEPAFGFPHRWSVVRWLAGRVATVDGFADPAGTAVELAEFLRALRGLPAPRDLAPGSYDDLSTWSLADRDASTRAAIAKVEGVFDTAALTRVWDEALAAPAWDGPPVWFHGDFHLGNLLTVDGRLSAVIDFGGLGTGDPACDLMVGWTALSPRTRRVFREALGVDDATWARGLGWGMATGLGAYVSYAATRPSVARATTYQVTQVLADRTGA